MDGRLAPALHLTAAPPTAAAQGEGLLRPRCAKFSPSKHQYFGALSWCCWAARMRWRMAKGRGAVPDMTLAVEPEPGLARMSELLSVVAQASDRQAFAQ